MTGRKDAKPGVRLSSICTCGPRHRAIHEMGKCPLLCTCDLLDPSERARGRRCHWHGGGRIWGSHPAARNTDTVSEAEIDEFIEEIMETKGET